MSITVELTDAEAIRACSAIKASVEKMRKYCIETDEQFGDMNDIYRDAISDNKRCHEKIVAALELRGYKTVEHIENDPIDEWR